MEGKTLARVGTIAFVAVAITATVIEMTRKEEAPVTLPGPVLVPDRDPLRADLTRCQRLGEAAARDAACLATWAESRRRFLGLAPAAAQSAVTPLSAGER